MIVTKEELKKKSFEKQEKREKYKWQSFLYCAYSTAAEENFENITLQHSMKTWKKTLKHKKIIVKENPWEIMKNEKN